MSKSSVLKDFLRSQTFIVHLLLALSIIFLIVYSTLKILDWYTLHGEEITVPDLGGVAKTDLARILEEKELRFSILDSSYMVGAEGGIVIGQNPPPMSKVKRGRTVYITISAVNPPSIRLPFLVDKSVRQASYILRNIGLKVGELVYRPDQCVNCVLAQLINGMELHKDTVVSKGTVVDLVLGGGLSEEKVLVPFLIGLTKENAMVRLKNSFLNVGAEVYDGSVLDLEDSLAARIYKQNPPYGIESWLFMGSRVDLEYTITENKIDTNVVILDSASIIKYVGKDSL